MFIISAALSIVLSIVLTLIVNDFYKIFFDKKNIRSKRTLQICLFVYFIIMYCMNFLEFPVEVRMAISCISVLILSFNYIAYLSNKVFGALSISVIIMGFELSILYLTSIILNISVSMIIQNKVLSLYLLCTARLIPFILIKWVSYKIYLKKWRIYRGNRLQIAESLMIIALPMCSLMLMYLIYHISNALANVYYIYISLAIIGMVAFNIIFYLVYFNSLKVAEVRANSKLQQQQIYFYNSYYNELKTNLCEIQKFKHDMKYILLNAISELADEQEIEIKKSLYNKLDVVIENFYLETHKNYTNNTALDLVLNYGVAKALRVKINIIINTTPNLEVNIDSKVLSVILGNAIDNAIEACINHKQETIKIYLGNLNNSIYIEIGNKYYGELSFEDDLPLTNKADPLGHGIGLKSIKKLVEQNGGIMFINISDGYFILQIHLINN